jgi:hypothetical protein
MQLSSLFLSAAALLAQVASAEKYALISTVLDPTEYGPARVKSSSAEASVGFENANLPVAKIPLDDGDIGAEFFCKTVGPGKWALLAKNDKEGSNPVSEHVHLPILRGSGFYFANPFDDRTSPSQAHLSSTRISISSMMGKRSSNGLFATWMKRTFICFHHPLELNLLATRPTCILSQQDFWMQGASESGDALLAHWPVEGNSPFCLSRCLLQHFGLCVFS